MKKTKQLLNPPATSALKALAISAVVVIHFFTLFKQSPFWNNSDWQSWAVLIDRLSRISVPLFVALSGYGLSQKYAQKLPLGEFYKNRLFKLLPPYLLWSVFYFFFAWFYYHWQMASNIQDFLTLLILGKVDYHLYFVPMILQLYLLFPLIFFFWKKSPKLTLLMALLFQLKWFWLFSYHNQAPFNLKYFVNDVEQYVFSPNWLWYFVLGFQLPTIISWLNSGRKFWRQLLWPTFVLSWLGLSAYSYFQLRQGINALNVLRFTQYHTMVFVTLGIIVLAWQFSKFKSLPAPLIWLGKYSYQLYLSHYLWLRLLFQIFLP